MRTSSRSLTLLTLVILLFSTLVSVSSQAATYDPWADFDDDGDVDIFDVVKVTSLYGCREGEPCWNPRVDVVEDGIINIFDVTLVSSYYGQQIPLTPPRN